MEQFGARLKTLRKLRELSRHALADKAEVAYHTIYKYETGEILPTAYVLRKISIALDVSADVLLGLRPLTADDAANILNLR